MKKHQYFLYQKFLLILISILWLPALCYANSTVTFVWDENSEEILVGYLLYQTSTQGQYTFGKENAVAIIPAGTETHALHDIPNGQWYWVLTAYSDTDESSRSNEVSVKVKDEEPHIEAPNPPTGITLSISETNIINPSNISVNHSRKEIIFRNPFLNPVIVANSTSCNEEDPFVVRICDVDSNGFDIYVQEWDYLDGNHSDESVNYIVMEQGTYILPCGAMVEAKTFNTNVMTSFKQITFDNPFNQIPVIIASVCSCQEEDVVNIRIRNISTTGFGLRMQEQELNNQTHAIETISYIAWEPSSGVIGNLSFKVAKTDNVVTDDWQTIIYEEIFPNPMFFANMQTTKGSDAANLQFKNMDVSQIDIKVSEGQSRDNETDHIAETVGYIIIGQE